MSPPSRNGTQQQEHQHGKASRLRGGGAAKVSCRLRPSIVGVAHWRNLSQDCFIGAIECFICFECCKDCCECFADIVCMWSSLLLSLSITHDVLPPPGCPCEMCC